eukprot:scaffold290472_cov27-Attheya_sp.AAC.1
MGGGGTDEATGLYSSIDELDSSGWAAVRGRQMFLESVRHPLASPDTVLSRTLFLSVYPSLSSSVLYKHPINVAYSV